MKTKAFTLIELLFVIIIIGILASIAYPQMEGFYLRAKLKEIENMVPLIYSAEKLYFLKNQEYLEWHWDDFYNDYITGGTISVESELNITLPKGNDAMLEYTAKDTGSGPRIYVRIVDHDEPANRINIAYYDIEDEDYYIVPGTKYEKYLKHLD